MKVQANTPIPVEKTFDLIGLNEEQMRFIVAAVYAAENRTGGGPARCSGFNYDARRQLYNAVGGPLAGVRDAAALKDGRYLSVEIAK